MRNSNILKIGIIGVLVLVVFVSGCTISTKTKTFSDGVMSFDYPGDFGNGTYYGKTNSSSSPMRVIGKLDDIIPLNEQYITIGKNITATSPIKVRNRSISKIKNMSNAQVLSVSTETNPNKIVVEKVTYTKDNLYIGLKTRNIDLYFKIKGNVYAISVHGPDDDTGRTNIANTTNIIFKSIK